MSTTYEETKSACDALLAANNITMTAVFVPQSLSRRAALEQAAKLLEEY